jgi:PIN domain nuclease of toxin-antitoxin system
MSLYVTDTHPLLWYSTETYKKLSPQVLRIFKRASNGEALIWVPAMALWEAGLLERIKRVKFKLPFREWSQALIAQPGFALAPLDSHVVDSALAVQQGMDVFDLSILATARAKDLPLITKDTTITQSKAVEVLW